MASLTGDTPSDIPVFYSVTATGDTTLDPLLSEQKWGASLGGGASLSYSFPTGIADYYESNYGFDNGIEWTSGWVGLDSSQRLAFASALAEFENVANVSFSELSESPTVVGDIRIAMTYDLSDFIEIDGATAAYAYYPFEDGAGGDIWLNPDFFEEVSIPPGSEEYTTLLHEIGHAMGLSHPFQNDFQSGGSLLSNALDNMFYTVMSYTLDPSGNDFIPDRQPTTLMLLDIQAIQHLYGANTSHNTGNNTYFYSDTGEYLETIWDGGGSDDWISYGGASSAAIIDLREGEWSSLGAPVSFRDPLEAGGDYTDERTVWIAYGTEIENAFGGTAGDLLIGNDLDNILDGDEGNDTLDGLDGDDFLIGWYDNDTISGGDGVDTAQYFGNRADYTVIDNLNGTWTVRDDRISVSGSDGTDLVDTVEYLQFADEVVTLIEPPNRLPVGTVSISGAATEGVTLLASASLTDADGLGSISFVWKVNGVQQSVASSYTLTQSDVGKNVTVTATYTDLRGFDEAVESAALGPVQNVNDIPMGDVLISGSAIQNATLTASNTIVDIDGLGTTMSYAWKADDSVVGSGPTYQPSQADVAKTITVTASYTDQFGTDESVESDPTSPVANINDDPVGTVTISGTVEQGRVLTANNNLSDLDGLGAITYTWKADNAVITTGNTYRLTQNEVGKAITVTASYTDQQDTPETVSSEPTVAVANINDNPMGTVTISGTPQQGQELSAFNTLTDLDGVGTVTYTWKAKGVTVGTDPTYTPSQNDVGEVIRVTAFYEDGQGTVEAVDAEPTSPISNANDEPAGSVTIDGSAEEGQLLTASNDLSDLDGLGTISYSWKADDGDVGSGLTYTPNQDDVGKTITVTAAYTDQFGASESVASGATDPVANVNDDPGGSVTISGTPEQGQLLTADNSLSDLDGLGTVSYSWKSGSDEVGTDPTYTPGQDDVGKTITVTASYTDLQGTEEAVESNPTSAVSNINDGPDGDVTIVGTAEQGQLLTAANTLTDLDGLGTISYSWKAGGVEVGTDPTYTTGQEDVGKTIILTASYTDQQGTDESVASEPTTAVANANDEPGGSVTISGIAEQGQLLTAGNSLTDLDGLGTISYSWK
ncbi:MAG: hypothetical protein ACI87W_000590, partial [Halieaceae bacterium]